MLIKSQCPFVAARNYTSDSLATQLHERVMKASVQISARQPSAASLGGNVHYDIGTIEILIQHASDQLPVTFQPDRRTTILDP